MSVQRVTPPLDRRRISGQAHFFWTDNATKGFIAKVVNQVVTNQLGEPDSRK